MDGGREGGDTVGYRGVPRETILSI